MSALSALVESKERLFKELSDRLFADLHNDEQITLSLSAENTFFSRFNQARVRQTTDADQSSLVLTCVAGQHELSGVMPLTWDLATDIQVAQAMLKKIRASRKVLPESHAVVSPENHGGSRENKLHDLPEPARLIDLVLTPVEAIDFAGLLVSGVSIRANRNSKGQAHWFSSESFYVDYSMYTAKQRAIKGCYAGTAWEAAVYERNIRESTQRLSRMDLPHREIPKGKYRTYLAPAAVEDLINMFSRGAVSGAAYKQGFCALKDLYDRKKTLSPGFSLYQDFRLGMLPRFNMLGEMAPESLSVIEAGEAKHLLVTSRTAKEYPDLEGNAAAGGEGLRSARMATGQLKREDILKELDTGLFVSNLHYLNWSDQPNARITGMTRFACFWVENGEIRGPIKDLRFDETLYNIFGDKLMAVTDFSESLPTIGSYGQRALGGSALPGILVEDFSYTL